MPVVPPSDIDCTVTTVNMSDTDSVGSVEHEEETGAPLTAMVETVEGTPDALRDWLNQVSTDYKMDVSEYFDEFQNQGEPSFCCCVDCPLQHGRTAAVPRRVKTSEIACKTAS